MNSTTRNSKGEALTDLILTMFRATNLTLLWGDRLVAPFGLTSARWQILRAIALSERPQPVAWIARDLGANRQNVQRIVNDLHQDGIVLYEPNPHHKRAHLVVLTNKGRRAYDAAIDAYNPKSMRWPRTSRLKISRQRNASWRRCAKDSSGNWMLKNNPSR